MANEELSKEEKKKRKAEKKAAKAKGETNKGETKGTDEATGKKEIEHVLKHDNDKGGRSAVMSMPDDQGRDNYILNHVRCDFPHIFDIPIFDGKPDKRSIKIIFDDNDERDVAISNTLQRLFEEELERKFADKPEKKPDQSEWAFRTKRGQTALTAKSDTPVFVVGGDGRTKITEKDQWPGYGGCYVNIRIAIWGQDNKWGQRVNCQLISCQFAGDGEPLDGKTLTDDDAKQGFGAVESTGGALEGEERAF